MNSSIVFGFRTGVVELVTSAEAGVPFKILIMNNCGGLILAASVNWGLSGGGKVMAAMGMGLGCGILVKWGKSGAVAERNGLTCVGVGLMLTIILIPIRLISLNLTHHERSVN